MLSNDFVNNEYDLLVQWREAIIFLEIGELDSILSTWSYYFLAHMVLLSRILSWYFKKTSLESIKTHHDSVVHLYKVYFKGKKIEIEMYMFWPQPTSLNMYVSEHLASAPAFNHCYSRMLLIFCFYMAFDICVSACTCAIVWSGKGKMKHKYIDFDLEIIN